MAIRIRKDRKKAYLVYWKNPFSNKMESQAFENKAEAEKLNALIQYRLKYERESFRTIEPVETSQVVPTTLEGIFYQYLKERNLDEANLENTLYSVKAILEKFGDTDMEELSTKTLYAMQKICVEAGNKGSTIRRKMTNIKAALNWAHRQGILNQVPVFPICPKSEVKKYIPPNADEVSRIYKVAPEHLRRVIILGFMCGVRVGPCELLSLRWSDVDFEHGVIRVKNAKKGNSDPWREIPIKDSLVPLIKAWQEKDREKGFELLVTFNGRPVKRLRHSWRKALREAGIERYIRPYDLRHGFATEAIAAGADYGTVAALMGHRSPMMVLQHYQHVKNSRRELAIEYMPQLDLV